MPLVSRTRATLRRAELGFLGVTVRTLVQTPRFCGLPSPRIIRFFRALKWKRRAGALVFLTIGLRPFRTSWLIVGTTFLPLAQTKGRKHLRPIQIWPAPRTRAARRRFL